MKNLYIYITVVLLALSSVAFSADFAYSAPSLTQSSEEGCALSSYTFKQKVPNDNNAPHAVTAGDSAYITFPAGTNATTYTGGTWNGTAITGAIVTATTIKFKIPAAVAKNKAFEVVLNGITNGDNITGFATLSADNTSGGKNSYSSYAVSTTACPTCTDGIRNGSETGIDCGGTCPACPTCVDGIQNGTETGVDCGGTCAACPTCSDGIQNGTETGVDCGGVCAVCPTCTDGIQNGTETGVDCGGTCPVAVCPTCSDGIMNGTETGIDCGGSCVACPEVSDLYNVVMNNTSSGVHFISDMITNSGGTVILNLGLMNTYGNELEVLNQNPNSVVNHTVQSYVNGNIRRHINTTGSYDFPVGNLTKGYQLANINFTSATQIEDLVARFDDWAPLAPPLNEIECNYNYNYDPLDNGYWTITADTLPTTGIYTATLYNTNYTNAVGDTITIMRNSGSGWELRNGDSCRLNSPNMVVRENMFGFSYFANAQGGINAVLSLNQLNLIGQSHAGYNHITWDYKYDDAIGFELLKSNSGRAYSKVAAFEKGKNTNFFDDYDLKQNVSYYRLKVKLNNNKEVFSNVVILKSKNNNLALSLYPNPNNGLLNLTYTLSNTDVLNNNSIEILDAGGRLVYSSNFTSTYGTNNHSFDLRDYENSIYLVKVRINNEMITEKIVLQK